MDNFDGLKIDGKVYSFDFNKLNEFIEFSWNRQNNETEILDNYNGAATLESKTVREFITKGDSSIDNIRYDLVKQFILQIITYDDEDFECMDDLAIGMKIAVATMINNGFLKEIKEK